METLEKKNPVVFTNKAHCRDCYRCVRVCPVKAIRMEKGQAYVDPERCIGCGTCVRECPQGAKQYREDMEAAFMILASGAPAAASVAPSLAAFFSDWEIKRLPSALRQLGFSWVGETAVGAYPVARETAVYLKKHPGKSHICTSCPAVTEYIRKYDPANTRSIVPVVSPMIAHARRIKKKLGKAAKIVFIGPCVAKKKEAELPEYSGLVDCVLTFEELLKGFSAKGIDLQNCEESTFDEVPEGEGRFFPLPGGSFRTAGMSTDLLDRDTVTASGFQDVSSALDLIRYSGEAMILEPLFCFQGCINGPAIRRDTPGDKTNLYRRKRELLHYANSLPGKSPEEDGNDALRRPFPPDKQFSINSFKEEEIRRVLEKTGKYTAEDELNCGACGYSSCREKAAAVLSGMAELEMCIPYMRRLAEKKNDKILETSPNGIIILDDQLRIIHMNPAFRRFFLTTEAVLGRPVSYLMDPEPFEILAAGRENKITAVADHPKYNLQCHQILYSLPEEKQYIGIFVDITHSRLTREKLDNLQNQVLEKTRELLEHQILSAQNIAKFLGESTARTEEILEQFVKYAGKEPGPENRKGN